MTQEVIERPRSADVNRVERTRSALTFRPNVDIIETEQELLVKADMPGVSPDDVNIQFENGTLTIHGRVEDRQPEQARFVHREYGVGDFFRTFAVSESIDDAKITAEFSDGVLTLRLPKVEAARPRRIEVKRT